MKAIYGITSPLFKNIMKFMSLWNILLPTYNRFPCQFMCPRYFWKPRTLLMVHPCSEMSNDSLLPLGKNPKFSQHYPMPPVVSLSSSHRSWFYSLLCYFPFLLSSDPSASEPFLIPLPTLECLPFPFWPLPASSP